MLVTSFKTQRGHQRRWRRSSGRTHPSLRGFSEVLHDPIFRDDLRNSLVITLAAVVISLVIGFFGALAIARFRFARPQGVHLRRADRADDSRCWH